MWCEELAEKIEDLQTFESRIYELTLQFLVKERRTPPTHDWIDDIDEYDEKLN